MNAQSPLTQFPNPGHPGVPHTVNTQVESECISTAQELHLVLKEEADILRRFAKADLLRLISKKEFLINELGQKLQCLKDADGHVIPISGSLKDLLEKIDQLNRSNRFFIQRSLAYWQDFLSIFIPAGYGPSGGSPGPGSPLPRGFSFSREV
jgi:flagellar biosynthesis/type III secretory pathway chaperone